MTWLYFKTVVARLHAGHRISYQSCGSVKLDFI